MDGAFVFVGPGGVGKDAFYAGGYFGFGLLFADYIRETTGNFFAALGEIFG